MLSITQQNWFQILIFLKDATYKWKMVIHRVYPQHCLLGFKVLINSPKQYIKELKQIWPVLALLKKMRSWFKVCQFKLVFKDMYIQNMIDQQCRTTDQISKIWYKLTNSADWRWCMDGHMTWWRSLWHVTKRQIWCRLYESLTKRLTQISQICWTSHIKGRRHMCVDWYIYIHSRMNILTYVVCCLVIEKQT
jgi:hypothetical protein